VLSLDALEHAPLRIRQTGAPRELTATPLDQLGQAQQRVDRLEGCVPTGIHTYPLLTIYYRI
jgi:hypothetical protein